MRMGLLSRTKWVAPLLIALSLSSMGCKSGWKMPGAGMMPWSRQPSASTLAADSTTPKLTEGPAAKHTPTALASAAAGTKPATTSTATYSTPTSAATATRPTASGTAATANQFQVGPYGMSSYNAAAGGTVPSSTSTPNQVSPTGGPTAMTGYPSGNYLAGNVYTGSAGLPPAATPPSSSPYGSAPQTNQGLGSLASTPVGGSAPAQYPSASAGYPTATPSYPGGTAQSAPYAPSGLPTGSAGSLSGGAPQSYSMPNATPNNSYSMPSYQPSTSPSGSPGAPVGYTPQATPGYPPTGSAGGATYPSPNVQLPPGSSPAFPGSTGAPTTMPGSMPGSTAPQATWPTAPAGASASPANSTFRPGTTARASTYNFGGTAVTTPASYPSPTATSPTTTGPAMPSGAPAPTSGYGSFQLPPNTANTTGPGLTTPPTNTQMYR